MNDYWIKFYDEKRNCDYGINLNLVKRWEVNKDNITLEFDFRCDARGMLISESIFVLWKKENPELYEFVGDYLMSRLQPSWRICGSGDIKYILTSKGEKMEKTKD